MNYRECNEFLKKHTGYGSRVMTAVAISAFAAVLAFGGAESSDRKKTDDLNARLAKVRKDLEQVQEEVSRKTMSYLKMEHDIVYADKNLKVLYLEVKKMEKDIVAKRASLQEKMMNNPEMKQANKERMESFEKQRDLQEQERSLLAEIASRGKGDVSPSKSAGK